MGNDRKKSKGKNKARARAKAKREPGQWPDWLGGCKRGAPSIEVIDGAPLLHSYDGGLCAWLECDNLLYVFEISNSTFRICRPLIFR
jgi:hypothetical protein